jgi:hypothetical protein
MTESPQQALRERVEDLEDARELDAAIRRHGDKPLIPWDQAKEELGLGLRRSARAHAYRAFAQGRRQAIYSIWTKGQGVELSSAQAHST